MFGIGAGKPNADDEDKEVGWLGLIDIGCVGDIVVAEGEGDGEGEGEVKGGGAGETWADEKVGGRGMVPNVCV